MVKYFDLVILFVLITAPNCRTRKNVEGRYVKNQKYHTQLAGTTRSICMEIDNTLKARHKTCFLRPETGPCRADVIQWYFDVKDNRCYRFFWGGCQGNGNKFESQKQCVEHCKLNTTVQNIKMPYFCSLGFEYGHCFGHFFRWGWDNLMKVCKRYLYSGCGGNQNNFQTRNECISNCLLPPKISPNEPTKVTTCIPMNYRSIN